jgi:hypothetical protein
MVIFVPVRASRLETSPTGRQSGKSIEPNFDVAATM